MTEQPRDKYATACIRIAEEVAASLTAALGEEWAEWGEGGLADGVRLLAQQRADAEKRGAVRALLGEGERGLAAAARFRDDDPDLQGRGQEAPAGSSQSHYGPRRADRVRRGDPVTAPATRRHAGRPTPAPSFGDHEPVTRYGRRIGGVTETTPNVWVPACIHPDCFHRLVARPTLADAKKVLQLHWAARHAAGVK